jgi:putative flippase GtrA
LAWRFVFDAAATRKTLYRLLGEYLVSGIIGIAITWFIIATAEALTTLPLAFSKILASAASFAVVYLIRRTVVFAKAM